MKKLENSRARLSYLIHISSLLKSKGKYYEQARCSQTFKKYLHVKLRFIQVMYFTESLSWDSETLPIILPTLWLQHLEHAHFSAYFHCFSFLFIQFENPLRQKLILAVQTHLARDMFLKGISRYSYHTSMLFQECLLSTYAQHRLLALKSSVRSKLRSCYFTFILVLVQTKVI